MATVSAATLKLRFPEFASQPDASVEFAIEEALIHVDVTNSSPWKDAANLALSFLAAHYLEAAIQRAASGTGQVIQSERIGEIAIAYMAQKQPEPANSSDMTTTDYGLRYLALASSYFPAIAIV